jgi:hypothetical protein
MPSEKPNKLSYLAKAIESLLDPNSSTYLTEILIKYISKKPSTISVNPTKKTTQQNLFFSKKKSKKINIRLLLLLFS